jgi:hypothetical protein
LTLLNSTISRVPDHNAGGFVQSQFGLFEQLFLTYGLRAEWNPGFGKDAQPNLVPRYGATFAHELGSVTAKLRASYGRATRPPTAGQKSSRSTADDPVGYFYIMQSHGVFDIMRASPELGPEYQQGGEGGLELYFGNRASINVTRYNQTVDALIYSVKVDSQPSLIAYPEYYPDYTSDPAGYFYQDINQNINVGSIRNQGWEAQGTLTLGPLTTRATYSWTKSRVVGITPKYRAQFTNNPSLQEGSSFGGLAEHTWSLAWTYARAGTSVSLDFNGLGELYRSLDELMQLTDPFQSVRLINTRPTLTFPSNYRAIGSGYTMADLNASHRFSQSVEGLLQVRNLGNFYRNDQSPDGAVMGRETKFGVRIRM